MPLARRTPAEAKALHDVWLAAFKAACRRRKMRFVSGEGYVLDDVYLCVLWPSLWRATGDVLKITWKVQIKPLALDEIFWAAFMPEVEMGPRMRLNRRVNGAFMIKPLQIADGALEVPAADVPDPHWEALLDEFDRLRAEFVDQYPGIRDFLAALRQRDLHPRRNRLSEVVTLIAAGRPEQAVALADSQRAAGESGGMSAGADAYEYVAAYAKGAAAHQEFLASLIPSHDLTLITETSPGWQVGLRRERHRGRFADSLRGFDGTDVWGLILDVRPPPGEDDAAAVRYLQAAGTASAMMIELRAPGGDEWGAVSVRSVVGRTQDEPTHLDLPIVLPRLTEMVSSNEVFGVDEAAELFHAFYGTSGVPTQYTLRPVEGYTAEGAVIPAPWGRT